MFIKRRWILGILGFLLAFNLVLPLFLHHFIEEPSSNTALWNGYRHSREASNRSKGKVASTGNKSKNNHVHIVFSTDCSGYQHWQSIALWYSAQSVGHQGNVTRIASGCSQEERRQIEDEWKKISPDQFRVHFTPSFSYKSKSSSSQKNNYKYSNKPGGLLHFLQHNNDILHSDDVLCLLDPDMLLLKPITSTIIKKSWTKHKVGKKKNQAEYRDENGTPQALRVEWLEKHQSNPPDIVTHGHPAGQHFGVGGAWARAMTKKDGAWQNFSASKVCGSPSSPCTKTSFDDADSHYAVGPVYLATVRDWHRIAKTWWEFFPRVYEQYPHLLAEMYAFCMAIANLQLAFTLLSNYMISSPTTQSPTEGWTWVLEQQNQRQDYICGRNEFSRKQPIYTPTVLHYCQNYNIADYRFAKRKISHTFFQCSNPTPLPLNRSKILHSIREEGGDVSQKTAFALCHSILMLNEAQRKYRKDVCT